MEIDMPCKVKKPGDCYYPEKRNNRARNPIHRQPTSSSALALESRFSRIAHDILRDELNRNPESKR